MFDFTPPLETLGDPQTPLLPATPTLTRECVIPRSKR
jgi:hypothetical protein